MFERSRSKRAQVDAVASASATCSGCIGTAAAVQVVYVSKAKKGTADNLATAWSSCSNCRATKWRGAGSTVEEAQSASSQWSHCLSDLASGVNQ